MIFRSLIMKELISIVMFAVLSQAINLGLESGSETNTCEEFASSCSPSPYRSYDGTCNNLKNPRWGSANSPYARMINNSYSDGIHAWPKPNANESYMNPRSISLMFPDVLDENPYWSIMTLQWGQLMAHDMSLTAKVLDAPSCCVNGVSKYQGRCKPIEIPDDDYFNAPEGNTCYDFTRTGTNKEENCVLPENKEEPFNSVTSYIDLSVTYGSSEKEAKMLRKGSQGLLKYTVRNGQQWPPQNPNAPSACSLKYAAEPCYIAGDKRVNQNPQLAITQTIMVREHNRIAKELLAMNPHWDDETCYQETRKILIAKAQHINYHEFLKIYLGESVVVEKGIDYPASQGYVDDYDETVNAQTLNEHATAAFRFFHTEIVGNLKYYTENRESAGNSIRLSEWFNRPSIIEKHMSGLTRGMCTQAQNNDDRYYDDEIWNYLFRKENKKLGEDLHAIDIQRSRDHGVGSYSDARKACGFPEVKSFDDLNTLMPKEYVKILKKIYAAPEDIELPVAGALENKAPGALAGPTFVCIMTKQFRNTRIGDRFFYTKPGGLTLCQLNAIRKTTMSRLICDNVPEIKSMQPYAFLQISASNSLVPCSKLPQVDLKYWKEDTKCKKNCDTKPKNGTTDPNTETESFVD